MYVSARSDYAIRAMLAMAADQHDLVKAGALAARQKIPLSFLHEILLDLRRAGLLRSHRGIDGGYGLVRPASEISVGDVLRAVGGALTTVRGLPARAATYAGVAVGLRGVWLSVDDAIGSIVDHTSLADLLRSEDGPLTRLSEYPQLRSQPEPAAPTSAPPCRILATPAQNPATPLTTARRRSDPPDVRHPLPADQETQ